MLLALNIHREVSIAVGYKIKRVRVFFTDPPTPMLLFRQDITGFRTRPLFKWQMHKRS